MNIYAFINSKDIREYLRKIKYEFSSLEAAWLIYQNIDSCMEEKHKAWEMLIEKMPDCEMPERNFGHYQSSLHAFLRKYIAAEKHQYEIFKEQERGAVYQYKFFCRDDCGWCERYETLFETEEECWNEIEQDMDLEIERIVIRKKYIGKSIGEIAVEYRPDKTVYSIFSNMYTDEEAAIVYDNFESMWFNFPVPFSKGDIVIEKILPGPYDRVSEIGAFVLKNVTPWNIENNIRMDWEKYGDNSDMNAWGYFQDEDGRIYSEAMHNYMDLEYYDGPIEGRIRLLKAISSYLKEEIDLCTLLSAYRKVILDEFTKDVMLTNWYSEDELEKAGLKNEYT